MVKYIFLQDVEDVRIPYGPFSGPCLNSEVGQGDIQRSLPTSIILSFCYLRIITCGFVFAVFFSILVLALHLSQSSLVPFGIVMAQYLYSDVTCFHEGIIFWGGLGLVCCFGFFPLKL